MANPKNTDANAADRIVGPEPNPPSWPDTVKLITPAMSNDDIMDLIRPTQDPHRPWTDIDDPTRHIRTAGHCSSRHFTDERHAILFAPGTYSNLDFEVGYYVQLAGLGLRPDDVVFANCNRGPYVEALDKHKVVGDRPGLSLDTFWRVAENYTTEARSGQLWAVSQAAPLRRVRIKGHLVLHDRGAYASGGHLANAIVGGNIDYGSQQQWLCRSVDLRGVSDWAAALGGGWSHVFVDCINAPPPSTGKSNQGGGGGGGRGPAVTVTNPAITVEKPFVVLRDDGTYELRVPRPRIRNNAKGKSGADEDNGRDSPLGPDLTGETDDARDFTRVHVAVAPPLGADAAATQDINRALDAGLDVVLSPGIYHLTESVRIGRSDQVVLGLGLATLVAPTDGTPCVKVSAGLEGVRIAGIMLEASVIEDKVVDVSSLLEWGEAAGVDAAAAAPDDDDNVGGGDAGNPANPGVLTDVFARVGGSNPRRDVSTDVMVRIHSGNILGDNLWLWRADHVALRPGEEPNFPPLGYHQVVDGECPCGTGLVVNGNDVTIHGLAVEHVTEHQTVWTGERGNVQFYQCEFPYDVTPTFGRERYLGYKVDDAVMTHDVGGIGVYSNFRDHDVTVDTAIYHPRPHQVVNPFIVKLDNGGVIRTVMNNRGGAAVKYGVPVRIEDH